MFNASGLHGTSVCHKSCPVLKCIVPSDSEISGAFTCIACQLIGKRYLNEFNISSLFFITIIGVDPDAPYKNHKQFSAYLFWTFYSIHLQMASFFALIAFMSSMDNLHRDNLAPSSLYFEEAAELVSF
jgi:hypothetical protein